MQAEAMGIVGAFLMQFCLMEKTWALEMLPLKITIKPGEATRVPHFY